MTVLDKECHQLKSTLIASQNECDEHRKEHESLLRWKTEKETLINDTEAVQNSLKDQLKNLEKSVGMLNDVNNDLKVRPVHYTCI